MTFVHTKLEIKKRKPVIQKEIYYIPRRAENQILDRSRFPHANASGFKR